MHGGAESGAAVFGRRAGAFFGAAAAGLGWGWFEAGWVRLCQRELEVPGLPPELDGLRVAHLSDFHLGVPSRGTRAVERAVGWVAGRTPELVCVTGDLLTHPRGERRLRSLVAQLPQPAFAVLGNHDIAISRDPQARASDLRELGPVKLLRDEGELVELRGRSVWIAGAHPRLIVPRRPRTDPNALSRDADFRILLCHFPGVIDRLEPGSFDLVLAGHLHAGQVCLPWFGGRLRLSQIRWTYVRGLYERPAGVLHVSAGLGTTFVPFRFLARPEATELILVESA